MTRSQDTYRDMLLHAGYRSAEDMPVFCFSLGSGLEDRNRRIFQAVVFNGGRLSEGREIAGLSTERTRQICAKATRRAITDYLRSQHSPETYWSYIKRWDGSKK